MAFSRARRRRHVLEDLAVLSACRNRPNVKQEQKMTSEEVTTVGQQLQNWLIRNNMDVTDALFVAAIDHAFENEAKKRADRANLQQPDERPNQS